MISFGKEEREREFTMNKLIFLLDLIRLAAKISTIVFFYSCHTFEEEKTSRFWWLRGPHSNEVQEEECYWDAELDECAKEGENNEEDMLKVPGKQIDK